MWLICRYDSNGAISFDQGMGSFAILMGRMLDLKLILVLFSRLFLVFSGCFEHVSAQHGMVRGTRAGTVRSQSLPRGRVRCKGPNAFARPRRERRFRSRDRNTQRQHQLSGGRVYCLILIPLRVALVSVFISTLLSSTP